MKRFHMQLARIEKLLPPQNDGPLLFVENAESGELHEIVEGELTFSSRQEAEDYAARSRRAAIFEVESGFPGPVFLVGAGARHIGRALSGEEWERAAPAEMQRAFSIASLNPLMVHNLDPKMTPPGMGVPAGTTLGPGAETS